MNQISVPRPNSLDALWLPFSDNKYFKRNTARMLARAEGMFYYTPEGREVLDGTAGLWCCNAGHGRREITEAIQRQAAILDFAPTFQLAHPIAFEAAARLAEITPEGLDRIFFTNSGSESADTALKIALAYHKARGEGSRLRLIGRERGYHGVGFGGMSVGGIGANRKQFGALLPYVDHLPHTHGLKENLFARGEPPAGAHLADALENLVALHGAETIAAVMVEPVAGSTGVLPPPVGYLRRLREICDRHGILLIFDEVITGFRLAPGGAQERLGVIPDIATYAKALGAGFPIAAFGGSREVMQLEATNQVMHGGTYTANVVALAAARAVLTEMKRRRAELWAVLDGFGERVRDGLREACEAAGLRCIVQGIGPVWHIYFAKPDAPALDRIRNYREAHAYASIDIYDRFNRAMLRRGVYFHPYHLERWFISTAHSEADVQATLEAAREAALEVARSLREQPASDPASLAMPGIAQ